MIKCIVSDFSWVLLFPKDPQYQGRLNSLHVELLAGGDYDFWSYFKLNDELLEYYKTLIDQYSLYIFTAEYIQEYPPVKEIISKVFQKVYIAAEMGTTKSNVKAYENLTARLGVAPDEILFIDDHQENVDAAAQAGWQTILFENTAKTIAAVKEKI
jgi:FMN phosphatase YigB (HAD superfamily)